MPFDLITKRQKRRKTRDSPYVYLEYLLHVEEGRKIKHKVQSVVLNINLQTTV